MGSRGVGMGFGGFSGRLGPCTLFVCWNLKKNIGYKRVAFILLNLLLKNEQLDIENNPFKTANYLTKSTSNKPNFAKL